MGFTRNSGIVIAGILIANVFAYLFHIYVARVLGPSDYGVFGALMALFLIAALPAGALSNAIAKFTARYSSNKEFEKIRVLRIKIRNIVLVFSSILVFLLLFFSKQISDYLKIDYGFHLFVLAFSLVFAMVIPINRGVLQGLKKFKEYSLNHVVESVARLVLVFVFVSLGFSVDGVIFAYGLSYLVAFFLIFPYLNFSKSEKTGEVDLNVVYKYVFLVLFVNVLMQIFINLPTVLIKHYTTAEFTGFWNAALTLAKVSLFTTGGIGLVMFSEVAGSERKIEREFFFRKAVVLTLIFSIGVALCFFLFGEQAVLFLYGESYLPAVSILEWLGIVMIPLALAQLWINYWLAKK